MNYYNLINTINSLAFSHPLVNDFAEGDVYEYMNSGMHKYPCIFLTTSNINVNDTSTDYNFTLFYIDRLKDKNDNKVAVQTTALNVIQQLLSKLINENIEFEIASSDYTVFTEKFADYCAGAFASLTLSDLVNKVNYDDIDCLDPNFEIREIEITQNGVYSMLGYDKAIINVPQGDFELTSETFTANGEYRNYTGGWNKITINVPDNKVNLTSTVIDKNGKYTNDEGGWNEVTVNIPMEEVRFDLPGVYYNEEGGWNKVSVDIDLEKGKFTKNGFYFPTSTGYSEVEVNIPLTKININRSGDFENKEGGWNQVSVDIPLDNITITENGEYVHPTHGGYKTVVVDTPTYEDYKVIIEEQAGVIEEQKNEIAEKNNTIINLTTENSELQRDVNDLTAENQYLEGENQQLETENNELANEVADKDTQISELNGQIATVGSKEITENGTYYPESGRLGWNEINVNVPSVTTMELTQDEYDALTSYDPNKIYLITE